MRHYDSAMNSNVIAEKVFKIKNSKKHFSLHIGELRENFQHFQLISMPFVFVVFFNSFSCARVGSAQNDQLSPLDEAWMSFKSYKLGSSQPSMDVVVATRRLFRAFYVGWIIIDYIPRAATQQVNTFAYWRAIFAQLEEKCQSEHWVVFNSRPTLKFQHVKNRLCFLLFLLRFSNIHWTFSDFSRVQLGTVNEREETLSRKKIHRNWASHREFLFFDDPKSKSTYCSVRFSRQIFSMHSRNVLSLQKSFGRVGDELTFSSRNRIMNMMAKIARNVVDIFSGWLFTGLTITES